MSRCWRPSKGCDAGAVRVSVVDDGRLLCTSSSRVRVCPGRILWPAMTGTAPSALVLTAPLAPTLVAVISGAASLFPPAPLSASDARLSASLALCCATRAASRSAVARLSASTARLSASLSLCCIDAKSSAPASASASLLSSSRTAAACSSTLATSAARASFSRASMASCFRCQTASLSSSCLASVAATFS